MSGDTARDIHGISSLLTTLLQCPPGHELTQDGLQCKDIDECGYTSGVCSNGVCENMLGTYQVEILPIYSLSTICLH